MARIMRRWYVLVALGAAGLIALSVALALIDGSEPALFDPAAVDTSGLDGAALFAASCARCHGAGATGGDAGPPLVHQLYRPAHHPDAAFITAVRTGVRGHHWSFGNMPAIPGLSDRELAAIIAFIRNEQARRGIR